MGAWTAAVLLGVALASAPEKMRLDLAVDGEVHYGAYAGATDLWHIAATLIPTRDLGLGPGSRACRDAWEDERESCLASLLVELLAAPGGQPPPGLSLIHI